MFISLNVEQDTKELRNALSRIAECLYWGNTDSYPNMDALNHDSKLLKEVIKGIPSESPSERSLLDILDSCKDGDMPTHEECYYAMLVLNFMYLMDHKNLIEALTRETPYNTIITKLKLDNTYSMHRSAMNKPPSEYLGWNSDPANPVYQGFREAGKKILQAAIEGRLPNQIKKRENNDKDNI